MLRSYQGAPVIIHQPPERCQNPSYTPNRQFQYNDEYLSDRFYSRENQQNYNAYLRMNCGREGVTPRRRILSPTPSTPSSNINNPSESAPSEHSGREEMLYQLSEEPVHWQFPKIIVGYQPMRPYINNGVHGLMFQPTMVYRAENMIYHLRNEDFLKPVVPQQHHSSDTLSEDEKSIDATCFNNRRTQEDDGGGGPHNPTSSKNLFHLNGHKNKNDSENLQLLDQNNISNEHIDNSDEEMVKPQLKMLIVKTVASQTNITLQSPDSLSVKKSYDNNSSAKSSSADLTSNNGSSKMSETVI